MKKSWWESGWWSVLGVGLALVFGLLTFVGLLFPSWFLALGNTLVKDPDGFAYGTAWFAIAVVIAGDLGLSWALLSAVKQARATRASAAPTHASPKRKSPMIYGAIVEGSYHKQTRQMVLVVAVQNPGEVPLHIQGFKSNGVTFAGANADVGWSLDAPPVTSNPIQGTRLTVRGIFTSKVTDTLVGTLPVRCGAVILRANFEGEALCDLSLLHGDGSSNISGPITVTSD